MSYNTATAYTDTEELCKEESLTDGLTDAAAAACGRGRVVSACNMFNLFVCLRFVHVCFF